MYLHIHNICTYVRTHVHGKGTVLPSCGKDIVSLTFHYGVNGKGPLNYSILTSEVEESVQKVEGVARVREWVGCICMVWYGMVWYGGEGTTMLSVRGRKRGKRLPLPSSSSFPPSLPPSPPDFSYSITATQFTVQSVYFQNTQLEWQPILRVSKP